jgi:hypothetical protein
MQRPSSRLTTTSCLFTGPPATETIQTEGPLVPQAIGRTLAQARAVMASSKDLRVCRPTGGQTRCQVTFAAMAAEPPRVWTVGLAKHSPAAAAVPATVTFTPPS